MKIAVVSVYPEKAAKHIDNASGVAGYTKNLLKNIPLQKGDEVYVICDRKNGKSQQYKEDGFTIVRAFDRGSWSFASQIRTAVNQVQPDVVHIQHEVSLYGGIVSAYRVQWLVRSLRAFRTVVTLHHVVNLQKITKEFVAENKSKAPVWAVKMAFPAIFKPLTRWADHLIVHEKYFKDILVKQYGASAKKITVVHHGVEDFTPLTKADARKMLNIPKDKHMVLNMGYLAGYKGFDLLLEGFAKYAQKDPKAYLVIGSGMHPKFKNDPAYQQEYADMQAKAEMLIGPEKYRWIGFIPEENLPAYYSACDVSLYTYTISMSSSGPMSFSVGYERAFLGSDVFNEVLPKQVLFKRTPADVSRKLTEFFAEPKEYQKISKEMKKERLWSTIGQRTKTVYEGSK
ncbi:MAG TPA: glycosyltransferase [Candidatus Saccharimonadales bacterium]|nr:glycosyltransferase [Candidatus Saccharimonadales bacterium]